MPGVTYYKPAGIPLRALEENQLSLEELEALRLRDHERLSQIDCAQKMNVSRPTFQRILASARRKIVDTLLAGKALRIEGGNYELTVPEKADEKTTKLTVSNQKQAKRKETFMKIAIISDQGTTISQHFGRASQYVVMNVEAGKITAREIRPKAGHHNFASGGHHEHDCGNEVHGHGAGASDKHDAMSSNILDCTVLLAGGMGWGAYESLKSHNIEPVITDVQDIEQAVNLYLENKLPNLMQRLH
jgi:predicted DNA-binding protein (UPF0251 family)/predicted Fe-Mo cluster-binding NifX family protein